MFIYSYFQVIPLTFSVLIFLQGWSIFCQLCLALQFYSCEEKGNALCVYSKRACCPGSGVGAVPLVSACVLQKVLGG